MNRKFLWYLASPYSKYEGGQQKAHDDVIKIMAQLVKNGLNIFCPIAHTHALGLEMGNALDSTFWTEFDNTFLELCDGVIVAKMPGWDQSTGVAQEIAEAEKTGKQIVYLDPDIVLNHNNCDNIEICQDMGNISPLILDMA